jgi:hypothetical protein
MTPRKGDLEGPREQPRRNRERDVTDRRSRRRFTLRLAVRYRLIQPRVLLDRFMVGESLNLSSIGLLFAAGETLLPGQVVEVFIDWPIRLHNGVRLTLVVEGAVVRSDGNHAAMHIEKYQFRTCAAAGLAVR